MLFLKDNTFYNQFTLTSQQSTITSLLSLNETAMLSGSLDTTIAFWKIKTDLTIQSTLYHSLSVQDVTELNDEIGSGVIATGSDDSSVNLWDSNNNFNLTANLSSHQDYVYALAYLGNGLLASASKDVSIRIWNTSTSTLLNVLYMHDAAVLSIIAIGQKNIFFASGSCDTTIVTWDYNYASTTYKGRHTDCVNSLALFNNRYLISGGSDKLVVIWELLDGLIRWKKTLMGHSNQVNAVIVFSNR
jgi:WD40 repeat protein